MPNRSYTQVFGVPTGATHRCLDPQPGLHMGVWSPNQCYTRVFEIPNERLCKLPHPACVNASDRPVSILCLQNVYVSHASESYIRSIPAQTSRPLSRPPKAMASCSSLRAAVATSIAQDLVSCPRSDKSAWLLSTIAKKFWVRTTKF